jgi:hypothetical protein
VPGKSSCELTAALNPDAYMYEEGRSFQTKQQRDRFRIAGVADTYTTVRTLREYEESMSFQTKRQE